MTASCRMDHRGVADQERRKEMKHKLITLILAAAVLVPSCTKGPKPVAGVIDFMAGTVTITDNDVTTGARVGDVVGKDAMIKTGVNSFAQIAMAGSLVQVYEQSSLILSGVTRDGSDAEETDVRMGQGTVFCRVKQLMGSRGDSFRVSSGVMVAAVRGTKFLYTVDCTTGKVICFEGVVSVRAADGTEEIKLTAGEMLSVESGKQAKVTPVPKKFRYRDFEYGKNAYMPEGASGDGVKNEKAESAFASGDRPGTGSRTFAAERRRLSTSSQRSSDSSTLSRKSADSSAAGTSESRTPAAAKTAVKKKDAGLTATSKKTATGETSGAAASTTGGTVNPGGLLEKPRVNVPELK
jgi:hypothetical protein